MSKSSGVPRFNIETWKNGAQRLVCRLNGKFCPIPEAMKMWKDQRKANPKPKKPLVDWNPLKKLFNKNQQLAKKGMTLPGSNDPTEILPGSQAGASTGSRAGKNKTTVRGTPPRGRVVRQGARGVQTQHKKGMDAARRFAPDLKRKNMDPFTRGMGGGKTRIQANTGIGTTTPQTPTTRPQTKTPPPSSPPTRPQTQPPTKPLSEGKVPTRIDTSPPPTPQTRPQTNPLPQNQVPTQGDNPTQIFNPGRGAKQGANVSKAQGFTGFEGGGQSRTPAQFFDRNNPLKNRNAMPTRIEKQAKSPSPPPKTPTPPPTPRQTPPRTTPERIAAQGKAWKLRQELGQNVPTTGKRAIAKFEAQKARENLKKVGEMLREKASERLDSSFSMSQDPNVAVNLRKPSPLTRLKQNIASVGEGLQSLGKSAKEATVRGVIATNEAIAEGVKRGKGLATSAGEAIGEAGKKTQRVVQDVGAGLFTAMKNASQKPTKTPKVPEVPENAIKKVAKKGTKAVGEAVGEGVNKAIDILTDPAVQIGVEVARTPHTLQKLKNKGAGPFETALTVGGRIVGAGAESVIIPKWIPKWTRLFTFGEDIGGAVAGTAGKVIDKSGAGKVIIDTTTQTAKALDKKFPGAQQIDINNARTRPKFKEMTGEL